MGTELKRGLAELGLAGARGCGCDERAALMDRRGVAWCEANVAVIVGWLREGAAAAGWGAQVTDEVLAAAVGVAIERFKGTSDGGQRPFEDSVTGG